MRKVDYNKIMYVIAVLLIICFCIFAIADYTNYTALSNPTPFYVFVFFRALEFILPSVILLYLYNQNTFVKAANYTVKSIKFSRDFKYKIAHISDFHNTNSKRIKAKIIKVLNKNKPE